MFTKEYIVCAEALYKRRVYCKPTQKCPITQRRIIYSESKFDIVFRVYRFIARLRFFIMILNSYYCLYSSSSSPSSDTAGRRETMLRRLMVLLEATGRRVIIDAGRMSLDRHGSDVIPVLAAASIAAVRSCDRISVECRVRRERLSVDRIWWRLMLFWRQH